MDRQVILSKRLQHVADLVSDGSRVCDVGCDHGFVSIYLIQHGIAPHVLAMDVNKGPLLRAKEHIEERNLSAYIETRLSNGLQKLVPGEADTVILAGMGGRLMLQILEQDPEQTRSLREFVLQPQSDIDLVRSWIREQGYTIRKEDMVFEDGKYYPMMQVDCLSRQPAVYQKQTEFFTKMTDERRPEPEMPQNLQDQYGPYLLAQRHPVLLQYLSQERQLCDKILEGLTQAGCNSEKQKSRYEEITEKKKQIEHILMIN